MEYFIRNVGAPYCIHIDNAIAETSRAWTDIMKKNNTNLTTSESYFPWQDSVECSIQVIKNGVEILMDGF